MAPRNASRSSLWSISCRYASYLPSFNEKILALEVMLRRIVLARHSRQFCTSVSLTSTTRRSLLIGSVSEEGTAIKIPDIQGEVRMNDHLLPGPFSHRIANWLKSSPALTAEYGKNLDVFQIVDGDRERSGAAVLRCRLSVPGSVLDCFFVLQSGAFDEFTEYLNFRAGEATSLAKRWAVDGLENADKGVVLIARHQSGDQRRSTSSSDEDEYKTVAEFVQISTTPLRPTRSNSVCRVEPSPDMQGIFSSFNHVTEFHAWQEGPLNENSSPPNHPAMFTASSGDKIFTGVTLISVKNSIAIFSSPFLTESVDDLPHAARVFERMISHVLHESSSTTARIILDRKDPFYGFAREFLPNMEISSSGVTLEALPAGLTAEEERGLLEAPFQFTKEMLKW